MSWKNGVPALEAVLAIRHGTLKEAAAYSFSSCRRKSACLHHGFQEPFFVVLRDWLQKIYGAIFDHFEG